MNASCSSRPAKRLRLACCSECCSVRCAQQVMCNRRTQDVTQRNLQLVRVEEQRLPAVQQALDAALALYDETSLGCSRRVDMRLEMWAMRQTAINQASAAALATLKTEPAVPAQRR